MKKFLVKIFSCFSLALMCLSCVEELDLNTENFEDALVVNAVITNENRIQQIRLSRTYLFEEDGPVPETGASVVVMAGSNRFEFLEEEPGYYNSVSVFAAQPDVDYKLEVVTSNGRSYCSGLTQLTPETDIDRVYAVRETNDDGVNGMSIYVDTFDPSGKSKYYQYEYEETFRVEPPSFVPEDLVFDFPAGGLDPCPDCAVRFEMRSEDKRICYRTETSVNTNLTNTIGFVEDRVTRYLVRFVNSDDYRISHRYSILVRQLVLSEEVFSYLQALSSFSEEGSLFSQVQAGFVSGNITSESNTEEKVIGYFEVASVSTKRIFFNYEDFYPGEPLPPYINSCQPRAPQRCVIIGFNSYRCGGLINGIRANTIVYKGMNMGQLPLGGRYLMVDRECGDCTALGDPEPPEFWIDE